eukprot:CAMPEP_0204836040 /NCGR_PEP_ID=MMETSP1346-20131115/24219_1 /ASSEMBLY_ACC=CAM_ASM_000771 /TAXON_ID=215587 /ORGANISM="Aplanochytrium stocchinoi, Strain GSBS06" /LENGTH=394 /DNA_ID=CAMNT_0051970503 /DNA_START=162 /DNA_END=1342 /DNA_ORIENTATION=+
MVLCTEDLDCDPLKTNKLCYANLSRFESPTDEFGCACNTFYGWTGDECRTFSSSTYFTVIIIGGTSIWAAYLLWQMIRVFVLSYKYEELWTPKFWTIILCTGGAFGIFGWSLMITLSALTVAGGGIAVDPDKYEDPYFGRWNFFSLGFGPIAVFGTALAVVNVAKVWLDIAFRTHTLDRSQTRAYKFNRRLLIFFQISVVTLALGAFGYEKLSPDGTSVYGFAVSLPIFAIASWYVVGYNKFMPILHVASQRRSDQMIDSTKKAVRETMRRVIVGLILYFIAVFVNSSLDTLGGSWKNFTKVGKVGPGKFFHHLQPVAICILIYAVYEYLKVLSTNGGFYMIIGVCNPEMVENPDFKGAKSKDAVRSSVKVTDMENGVTSNPNTIPPGTAEKTS